MSAPMALLKCRLHPIVPEVEAEPEEIRERILIIRVDEGSLSHGPGRPWSRTECSPGYTAGMNEGMPGPIAGDGP
jgi:hypothetical protein